jgi:hypothetical protein
MMPAFAVSAAHVLMMSRTRVFYLRSVAILLLFLGFAATSQGQQILRTLEFKHVDGGVRLDNGRVVFSHYDESGNAHNVVLLDVADASVRTVVEGVPGARFVAEDERFLVYSSRGSNANPLVVRDKRGGARVASVRLRNDIRWGHIDGDRLILIQDSGSQKSTVLVYRLPGLKLEHSTEIIGGNDTSLWNDKIVSIGFQLGIYDLQLRQMALVDMPARDPDSRFVCGGGPLRISGDKAVVGANCGQLVVVDLPSARIERGIRTESLYQSFDIADGLIFTVNSEGKEQNVRVIELSSGRELSRIGIDTNFVAMRGNHLLGIKTTGFSKPVQFTLYEVDFRSIRSEESRVTKVTTGCHAAEQSLAQNGDVHAAIEACEDSGIRGFSENVSLTSELSDVVGMYAVWLARSLSRYEEGIGILERLNRTRTDQKFSGELARARQKATYLDPPIKGARPVQESVPAGVDRVSFDFGTFPNLIQPGGDRTYVGRWSCGRSGEPGVTLDVLERGTLKLVKRVVVATCDDEQQDSITTIAVLPEHIVVALGYRYAEQGRPNVAVIDAKSLEVVKKGFLNEDMAGLRRWNGKLLACATSSSQATHRFDPASVRLVAASEQEVRACANNEAVALKNGGAVADDSRSVPVTLTPHYRVYGVSKWPETSYRLTKIENGDTFTAKVKARRYMEAIAIPEQDALVLTYSNGPYHRFARFDIATQSEVVLFELNPVKRPIATAAWRNFLFVSIGRDLLVYDLQARATVAYEKDLIREGFLNNCCGVDRNGITRLSVDGNRMLILTFDGENSRLIDLPVFLERATTTDFFTALRK